MAPDRIGPLGPGGRAGPVLSGVAPRAGRDSERDGNRPDGCTLLIRSDRRFLVECLEHEVRTRAPGIRVLPWPPGHDRATPLVCLAEVGDAPGPAGMAALLADLRDEAGPDAVLILARTPPPGAALDWIRAGARGVVPFDASLSLMIAAVGLAAAGGHVLPADEIARLAGGPA